MEVADICVGRLVEIYQKGVVEKKRLSYLNNAILGAFWANAARTSKLDKLLSVMTTKNVGGPGQPRDGISYRLCVCR